MKQKNKKTIIISIIVLVIIIFMTIMVYAYFSTDIFRSNKDSFFKYIAQTKDIVKDFNDQQLKTYIDKQKNTPYINNGKIIANIDVPDAEEQIKHLKDFNITIQGKNNKFSSQVEQNIIINYSQDVNFPVNYKQENNALGVQTKYIGKKYLVVKNENLKDLFRKVGIPDIDNIPNTIDFENITSSLNFTQEDINYLEERYITIIENELKDEYFSKVDNNGYMLTLNEQQTKDIIIKLLQSMEQDELLLEKINNIATYKITSSDIQEIIGILKDSDFFIDGLKIITYKQNNKLLKIEISTDKEIICEMCNNKILINLQKIIQNSELQYLEITKNIENEELIYNVKIHFKDEKGLIYFRTSYKGLEQLNNIEENYTLGIEMINHENENMKYEYLYTNQIEFTDSLDIDYFDEDNSTILNDYESENLTNLINAIIHRMSQVIERKMEELGEVQSSLNLLIPSFNIYSSNNDSINIGVESIEVQNFNSKFEMYEGNNVKGSVIKSLLMAIESTNLNENKIEIIIFDDQQIEANISEIEEIISKIDTSKTYTVETNKDFSTKKINKIIINGN